MGPLRWILGKDGWNDHQKTLSLQGDGPGGRIPSFHLAAGQGERPGRLRPEPFRRRDRRGGGIRSGCRGFPGAGQAASCPPWRRSPELARRRSRLRARMRLSSPKARATPRGISTSPPTSPPATPASPSSPTPADRRFRYPFINCTDCGPRLTIINAIPYDRSRHLDGLLPDVPGLPEGIRKSRRPPVPRRTQRLPRLRAAAGAPGRRRTSRSRRAIPWPGPSISSRGVDPGRQGAGRVSPVRGCSKRRRPERTPAPANSGRKNPWPSWSGTSTPHRLLSEIGDAERRLLLAPERPIVLLRRREGAPVSPLVAPGIDTLGIMLPYTPLQHLLLGGDLPVLVMTSANQTDEPICIGNREALRRLRGDRRRLSRPQPGHPRALRRLGGHGRGGGAFPAAPVPGIRPQTRRPEKNLSGGPGPGAPDSREPFASSKGTSPF